jgi:hypothetical protein
MGRGEAGRLESKTGKSARHDSQRHEHVRSQRERLAEASYLFGARPRVIRDQFLGATPASFGGLDQGDDGVGEIKSECGMRNAECGIRNVEGGDQRSEGRRGSPVIRYWLPVIWGTEKRRSGFESDARFLRRIGGRRKKWTQLLVKIAQG